MGPTPSSSADAVGRIEPPAGLRLGVTGHRPERLAGADLPVLRTRVATVLTALRAASGGRVSVVSALAEGADQLVAEEAVAAGLRLVCPLPFPVAAYERDFSSVGALEAFRAMLARAAEVEELPGSRLAPDLERAAYAAVGVRILDRADVLLTIWDGARSRGAGGTADVVAQAYRRDVPVVWIAASPPHWVRLLDGDPAIGEHAQASPEAVRASLTP